MRVSDYIIIYFSIGSPFAVYAFLQVANLSIGRRFAASVVTLVTWPFFAAASIYRKFWREPVSPQEILDRKIREIRNEIEAGIRDGRPAFSPYGWRDIFERYVGLAKAVGQSQDDTVEMELFAIDTQKNGKLGTICLNRRNRNRLIFHHTQARNDFVDALMATVGTGKDAAVLTRAIDLANLLGDADAVRELTAMISRPGQNSGKVPVINLEQEVWNPPTPKPQPANRI